VAKLIIYEEIEGAETIFETFDLSASRILIGSDPDNHLILEAPEIDPSHASLELRDSYWVIQDLGGPHGTDVNGQQIQGPCRLNHMDLIELGQVKMKFHEFDHEPETEPSSPQETSRPTEKHISGRVWFATVTVGTIGLIFVIIVLLAVAHYLGVINITDLLPPWLVG
jgi:pSer/pThr/pTyr-binding forkhead associated (FHA) protein